MGEYDEVIFRCPHCQEKIECQSKAGKFSFETFNADDVPVSIADDLNQTPLTCTNCGSIWVVRARMLSTAPCDLVTPPVLDQDDLDHEDDTFQNNEDWLRRD